MKTPWRMSWPPWMLLSLTVLFAPALLACGPPPIIAPAKAPDVQARAGACRMTLDVLGMT